MRTSGVLVIAFALILTTSCSNAANGTSSNNASAKNGGGGGSSAKAAAGSNAEVPDPHASSNPKVGREAGVGDDPANLESADPKGGGGDSGKPGPAQKP